MNSGLEKSWYILSVLQKGKLRLKESCSRPTAEAPGKQALRPAPFALPSPQREPEPLVTL